MVRPIMARQRLRWHTSTDSSKRPGTATAPQLGGLQFNKAKC